MVTHSSASPRTETPHANNQKRSTNRDIKCRPSGRQILPRRKPLSDDVRKRALAILNNQAINAEIRGVIRYGLEIDDPWTPDHVRRVEAGENILDNLRPKEPPRR
jgi:hypothetical protein